MALDFGCYLSQVDLVLKMYYYYYFLDIDFLIHRLETTNRMNIRVYLMNSHGQRRAYQTVLASEFVNGLRSQFGRLLEAAMSARPFTETSGALNGLRCNHLLAALELIR